MSAPETPCRGCGAPIVFLRTKKNRKLIPVNADTVNREDGDFDPERHVAHFATCTEPETFRKPRVRRGGGVDKQGTQR